MDKIEFLKEILPEGARYSIRYIKDGVARNRMYDEINGELERDIGIKVGEGWNVYYATAGFGSGSKADADNATSKQELYLDVDCGASKPYATKGEGMLALKSFVESINLPRPTLVDSGNGIHAHWVFDSPIPIHEWKELAVALKQRCDEAGFTVDAACTADTVRVLRVPETTNFRGGHTVKLLTMVKRYAVSRLREAVGLPTKSILAAAKALTQSAGTKLETFKPDINSISVYQTILETSLAGIGCAQIKHGYENRTELSEPEWRAHLSIANYCEDREWAIHAISEDHPGYDAEDTEAKAALTKGPYTCETFQRTCDASHCANCTWAGKIKSPIQIGNTIKFAAPEETIVVSNNITYEIPVPPWPFTRGANGGLYYTNTEKGKEEPDPEAAKNGVICVYPYDIYIFEHLNDFRVGNTLWFRIHLPNNDVREFSIPQGELGSRDKLRDALAKQGATIFNTSRVGIFQLYAEKQIRVLQEQKKAEKMRARFGWTLDETFIVGDREYGSFGARRTQIAKSLDKFVRLMTPRGSLEEWKAVAAKYDDPQYDTYAFGVMAGFGSILMHMSPERGGLINYYSKESGTGKTSIQRLATSIWGSPELMKTGQDTYLSKIHRMGTMNGIVVCVDEMTNASPEEISNGAYSVTTGRARDRMEAGANVERENDTSWELISIWSSNASIESRLALIKVDPKGELARVIEIPANADISKDALAGQKLFEKLDDNYGHAGDIFLRAFFGNPERARSVFDKVRDTIYGMRDWTQTERFKLNLLICSLAGGILAKQLGLINYNIGRITRTMLNHVYENVQESRRSAVGAIETFSMFFNKHVNNLLVIEGKDRVSTLPVSIDPMNTPRGPLIMRYEPDTKSLFITQREFNKWCAEVMINAREIRGLFLKEVEGIPGAGLNLVKKRMSKGWKVDSGPVMAYEIPNAPTTLGVNFEVIKGEEEV